MVTNSNKNQIGGYGIMTNTYDKYKKTNEWAIVQKAINDLVENQDLKLTTANYLVVGYITKQLVDKKKT